MKKLLSLLLVIILAGITVVPAYADDEPPSEPNVPIGVCLAYASAPSKSGSSINSSGGVNCTEKVPYIRIVGQMIDNQSHIFWPTPATKTCSNKNSCTWSVSTPYKPGRNWRSMTSGYWSTGNDYKQSRWVYFP